MTTTTQVSELMTRQATVAEASQVPGREEGSIQWALKLEIKDISQFPIPCFMPIERAAQVLKGSVHTVTMRKGRLKRGKDGKYPSDHFWELTHWDVQVPVQQVSPPPDPDGQGGKAESKPTQATTPGLGGQPWDAADTQSRISWAQAINLAVEAIGGRQGLSDAVVGMIGKSAAYMIEVEVWANLFYPLIRKGPTMQEGDIDPETLPFDAPQPHQEATDEAPEPVALSKRLPNQPDKAYFFMVANKDYGLMPTAALEKLGTFQPREGDTRPRVFGNYEAWVAEGHTLAEALEKLGPAKGS